MTVRALETALRRQARMAGVLYLIVIVAGIFAEIVVRDSLIVAGDAAATAHNLMTHEPLYRWGGAAELCALVCNIPLAVIFYAVFKIVNRNVALLVVFFGLIGTAIEGSSLLNLFAPLLLLGDGPARAALPADQLQALAYTPLQLFDHGFAIALVFFGCFGLSLGYLVFRSTFLPRIVGVLLAVGGVCYVINNFAYLLAPLFQRTLLPYILLPSGLGELALTVWFLVRGVNSQRWQEQAARNCVSAPVPGSG
jgi:hypothetical protein